MTIGTIDPVIHPPKRLAAMAILNSSTSTDFSFLRSHLGCSDSDLSKQMAALGAAGYVAITKTGHGRGASTTYRITSRGKQAYTGHLDALRAIVGAAVDAPQPGSASSEHDALDPADGSRLST